MKKLFMFGVLFLVALTLAACTKDPTITFPKEEIDMELGQEITLAPVVSDKELEVVYSVGAGEVVSLDGAKVTALRKGEATITATFKDTKISATVKIFVGRDYDVNKQIGRASCRERV